MNIQIYSIIFNNGHIVGRGPNNLHSQLFSPTNHVRNEFASDSWAMSQVY